MSSQRQNKKNNTKNTNSNLNTKPLGTGKGNGFSTMTVDKFNDEALDESKNTTEK